MVRAVVCPKVRPVWAEEFEAAGGKLNTDGTVRLFHATRRDTAAQIHREKVLRSPADAPDAYGVYLSSSDTVACDYGDGTVVPVTVCAADLQMDDAFPGRRVDFLVETRKGVYKPVRVGKPVQVDRTVRCP